MAEKIMRKAMKTENAASSSSAVNAVICGMSLGYGNLQAISKKILC